MGTLLTNGFRIVKTIKASTKKTIESKFKKHILHRFATLKIKDISKAYCQKMINEIADTINSVNDIKNQANDDSEINERNFCTKEEIKHFLEISKNEVSFRDHVLFHLLIYTGDC